MILTKAQEELWQILTDRDLRARTPQRLADMFAGACHAMNAVENPGRVAQSAHSMRELLEKLPLSIGDELVSQGLRASDAQQKIAKAYAYAKSKSVSYRPDTSEWVGEIDGPLRRLLEEVGLAANHQSTVTVKRQRSLAFIKGLDPTGDPTPGDIGSDRIDRWMKHDKFFQLVAHHRTVPTPEAYAEAFDDCTQLLLQVLRVDTVATFDLLDQIISAGEGQQNADS